MRGGVTQELAFMLGVFGLEWIVLDGSRRSEKRRQEHSILRMYDSTGESA